MTLSIFKKFDPAEELAKIELALNRGRTLKFYEALEEQVCLHYPAGDVRIELCHERTQIRLGIDDIVWVRIETWPAVKIAHSSHLKFESRQILSELLSKLDPSSVAMM